MCVPKHRTHGGMSARCYSTLYRTAPRDFRARFPSLENICLPSFIRSVPRSTYEFRQFPRNPRVYIYVYLNIFKYLDFLRFLLE